MKTPRKGFRLFLCLHYFLNDSILVFNMQRFQIPDFFRILANGSVTGELAALSHVAVARTKPGKVEPVSPIKIFAGFKL